jgi:hypothetical protein
MKFLGQTAASRCEDMVKPPAHPADGDGVGSRNVGKPHLDAAVYPRKFN